MNTVNSPIQLRVTITDELRDLLQQRAEEYGLTMSAYIKHLIIQDMKDVSKLIYQPPLRKVHFPRNMDEVE